VRITNFLSVPSPSLINNACFLTKAETINWLLKKKSGTRNRRNPLASAEDRTPATHTGNGTPAEGEVDEDKNVEVASPPVFDVVPTRYHGSRHYDPPPDAPPGDKMRLSFSVPRSLLPAAVLNADGDSKVDVQEQPAPVPKPRAPAVCDIDGCTMTRK
jgi:Ino eighty subunit 2